MQRSLVRTGMSTIMRIRKGSRRVEGHWSLVPRSDFALTYLIPNP